MSIATPVYNQLLSLLSEYSPYRDLRHLKALAWMINALICSGTINRARMGILCTQSWVTSPEYRKKMGFDFSAIIASELDPCMCQSVMAAISNWHHQRLYLALDTTVLWNRFCIIHLSIVCCGRAVPYLLEGKRTLIVPR